MHSRFAMWNKEEEEEKEGIEWNGIVNHQPNVKMYDAISITAQNVIAPINWEWTINRVKNDTHTMEHK